MTMLDRRMLEKSSVGDKWLYCAFQRHSLSITALGPESLVENSGDPRRFYELFLSEEKF